MMARGMEAQDCLGAWRTLNAEALVNDGNSAVGTYLQRGPEAPNIGPPGTVGGWAQDGPFLSLGDLPGPLRGHPKLAVGFMSVAMEP